MSRPEIPPRRGTRERDERHDAERDAPDVDDLARVEGPLPVLARAEGSGVSVEAREEPLGQPPQRRGRSAERPMRVERAVRDTSEAGPRPAAEAGAREMRTRRAPRPPRQRPGPAASVPAAASRKASTRPRAPQKTRSEERQPARPPAAAARTRAPRPRRPRARARRARAHRSSVAAAHQGSQAAAAPEFRKAEL